MYVGQTSRTRFSQRMVEHRTHLRGVIGAALRKYGETSFHIDILEDCEFDVVDDRERYWIAFLGTMVPDGYNLTTGGRRPAYGQETKQKMSIAALNRIDEVWKARMHRHGDQHSQYGTIQTKERIQPRIEASQKRYIVCDLNGTEQEVLNLSRFCRENGLNIQTMNNIANGTGTAKQHRGYSVRKV